MCVCVWERERERERERKREWENKQKENILKGKIKLVNERYRNKDVLVWFLCLMAYQLRVLFNAKAILVKDKQW